MLWASFVVFLAVGIIGIMSGVLVMNSDRANYYPWAMPELIANNFLEIGLPISQLILNLVRGIILFILVNWDLSQRDVIQ